MAYKRNKHRNYSSFQPWRIRTLLPRIRKQTNLRKQINIFGLFNFFSDFYVFLAYGVLKTIDDTSYLRKGVLPQASFRLTAVEGGIPTMRSEPSAPPAVAAVSSIV